MVKCLVEELGADVNQTDDEGYTPLIFAAVEEDLAMVRCLLKDLGADVHQADHEGTSPLYIAAEEGKMAMVQCLVKELHADVNQGDRGGRTPLKNATETGNLAMVRCLVKDLHADVNKADDLGRTPLQVAALQGDLAMVRVLEELHADVNNTDHEVRTPLWIAAQEGNLAMVQCLVKELGADIDRKNRFGGTPLIKASAKKHADIVKWLVKAGANTQASVADGKYYFGTAASISKLSGASAEQTAYLEAKTHCTHPSCSGAGLLKCTGCWQARYCPQLAHWKAHKTNCRRWSAELAAGTGDRSQ
jgi:ankyrin repeat protein